MLSISQIVDVCSMSPLAPMTFSPLSMAGAARAHPRPHLGSRIDRLHLLFLPGPPICRIMAARVIFHAHRRAPSPSAMASTVRVIPLPQKAPGWMCPFPRFRPVVSGVDLVAVGPHFPRTGELPDAANGGATISTPNSGGHAPFLSLPSNLDRPI
jgi:hypothetical protein